MTILMRQVKNYTALLRKSAVLKSCLMTHRFCDNPQNDQLLWLRLKSHKYDSLSKIQNKPGIQQKGDRHKLALHLSGRNRSHGSFFLA